SRMSPPGYSCPYSIRDSCRSEWQSRKRVGYIHKKTGLERPETGGVMSFDMRATRGRLATAAVVTAAVVSLLAAAAEAQLDVLEEVVVRAKKVLPLEGFAEFPRYDSVAISPNGKLLAIGWTDDENYQR